MKNNSKFMKKFKFGTISIVTTAIVVAIVIVINVLMGLVTAKTPIKVDLTQDKRYELSKESKEFLKTLGGDVEITVTLTEEDLNQGGYYFTDTYRRIPTEIIPQFLDKYKIYSEGSDSEVTIKYVDIEKSPDAISKYSKVYNGTISAQQVIVYANERVKVLPLSSLFSQATTNNYTQISETSSGVIFTGESALTTAIMSVTDAKPVNAGMIVASNDQAIYSTTSHYPIMQLYSTLDNNGYKMSTIDILKDEISTDDYELIIIAAPEIDFTEDAIAKLEDFLYNDGNYQKNVIYISSIGIANTPNINEFLAKWNVQIEDGIVLDDKTAQYVSTNAVSELMAPVVDIVNAEAVGELSNSALPIVAPYSRAITLLTKNNGITTSAILQSANTSYTSTLEDSTSKSENGVNNVMTLSTRSRSEQYDVYESKLMTIGCVALTDINIMTQTSAYNNANFILNAINTLVGKDSSFVIPNKELQTVYISVTQNELKTLRNIIMYIIPGVIVILGIVVFIRRKNR